MNTRPITDAFCFGLRQWRAFLLVVLSLPALFALGFCGDVLFHQWQIAVPHSLGGKPLPPLSELLDTQVQANAGTLTNSFLSFAALLFLWFISLLLFASDESRLPLTFLYGFLSIWLCALSFLGIVCVSAALPFINGLQRMGPPQPATLSRFAPMLVQGLLSLTGAVILFGLVRLGWRYRHARLRNSH